MKTVWAFDVDDTLEISNGPVTLEHLNILRIRGDIVGLCGNWGLMTSMVDGWQHLISFFNCGLEKSVYLTELSKYVRADRYVMVGNIGPICASRFNLKQTGGSNDMCAAKDANPNWEFVVESEFPRVAGVVV